MQGSALRDLSVQIPQTVSVFLRVLKRCPNARYEGRFCKKAGRSQDGSAIFWKTDKLSLVEESAAV